MYYTSRAQVPWGVVHYTSALGCSTLLLMSLFDWSVCVVKSSVDSCLQCGSIQIRGAEGPSEQCRGLLMKALMQDLGTRLECRHRVFVKNGKTLWK